MSPVLGDALGGHAKTITIVRIRIRAILLQALAWVESKLAVPEVLHGKFNRG